MRIGIVHIIDGSSGGIYQYSLIVLQTLSEWKQYGSCPHEFVAFAEDFSLPVLQGGFFEQTLLRLHAPGFRIANVLRRILREGPYRVGLGWYLNVKSGVEIELVHPISFPQVERIMKRRGVELVLYFYPCTMAFEVGLPYVMAIHDLQHRLQPEFPEVAARVSRVSLSQRGEERAAAHGRFGNRQGGYPELL